VPWSRIRISGIRQSGDVERKILLFPGEPEHLLALHFASESTRSPAARTRAGAWVAMGTSALNLMQVIQP
jgi:hypothetical protein